MFETLLMSVITPVYNVGEKHPGHENTCFKSKKYSKSTYFRLRLVSVEMDVYGFALHFHAPELGNLSSLPRRPPFGQTRLQPTSRPSSVLSTTLSGVMRGCCRQNCEDRMLEDVAIGEPIAGELFWSMCLSAWRRR